MRRPNLLFLFTDEQRADTLADYGNHKIQMPNLNRLARHSVVFEPSAIRVTEEQFADLTIQGATITPDARSHSVISVATSVSEWIGHARIHRIKSTRSRSWLHDWSVH